MKLGRNELCHCGSNRKYKVCCAEKDALAESSKQVSYDKPILVEGVERAECDEWRTSDEYNEEQRLSNLPEIPTDELPEEDDLLRRKITPADNNLRATDDGEESNIFVLRRTGSSGEFGKPEYASRGFSWYLETLPDKGGYVIAYFKDVEMACTALDLCVFVEADYEEASQDDSFITPELLNEMRRTMVFENDWSASN